MTVKAQEEHHPTTEAEVRDVAEDVEEAEELVAFVLDSEAEEVMVETVEGTQDKTEETVVMEKRGRNPEVVAEEEVPESMMMVTSQTHVEERVEEMTEEQEKVGNQEREEKVTDHQEAAVDPEEVQEETMVELTTMETDQEEVVHVSQEPTVKEVEEAEEAAEAVVVREAAEEAPVPPSVPSKSPKSELLTF